MCSRFGGFEFTHTFCRYTTTRKGKEQRKSKGPQFGMDTVTDAAASTSAPGRLRNTVICPQIAAFMQRPRKERFIHKQRRKEKKKQTKLLQDKQAV